LEEGGENDKK